MMGRGTRDPGQGRTPHTTSKHGQYSNRSNQSSHIDSLKRLHGDRKCLIELAGGYATRMKAVLPVEPLEAGVMYQLGGKQLHGVDCFLLLIVPNRRAILVDFSTGVVGSVDKYGVERVSMIGGRRDGI